MLAKLQMAQSQRIIVISFASYSFHLSSIKEKPVKASLVYDFFYFACNLEAIIKFQFDRFV